MVFASLWYNEVGVFLGWFDKLLVHGFQHLKVAVYYHFHRAAAFKHVALDVAYQTLVRVGVDEYLKIHHVAQLFVQQRHNALYYYHRARLHVYGFLQSVTKKVRVSWLFHGVAVAHAKTECVKRIEIALGISHRGIDFDSIDRLPVHLLFLIATPPYKSEIYLKLLSVLMTVMRNSDLREKLLALTDVNQIESLLDERFRCCYRAKTLDDI